MLGFSAKYHQFRNFHHLKLLSLRLIKVCSGGVGISSLLSESIR
jgi:hypothetical protein